MRELILFCGGFAASFLLLSLAMTAAGMPTWPFSAILT